VLTRIGVKTRVHRNLYVLVVLVPGSRRRILQRRISRRPWRGMEPGTLLRIGREKLRIIRVERTIERREHVTWIETRAVRKRRRAASNVVPMPRGRADAADRLSSLSRAGPRVRRRRRCMARAARG